MKLSKESVIIAAILIVSVVIAVEAPSSPHSNNADSVFVSDTLEVSTAVSIDSVSYVADSIYYNVAEETIHLTGNSEMIYHNSSIKADEIIINLSDNQSYTIGETWMQDGTQILVGRSLTFDFPTQTGVLFDGASRLEKGFYYGAEIRKVGEDVYDIDRGYFTTCDLEEPNFYIYSQKMRLFYRDKIVAKPIIFLVNRFPIFILPFGTFPVKTERASGILVPEPGYNSVDGKYIENIALYYGENDYMEALAALDWREYTGWEARFVTNYIRRYHYRGNLLVRYQNRIMDESRTNQEWYLRAQHSHDFIDRSSFDANLEFMSSRTVWEGSDDIDERLTERITSTIAYRKPFQATTLNTGATYTEDLRDDRVQVVLPTVSYSLPSKPVYELFTSEERTAVERWWQNFYYSYSVRGIHQGTITKPSPSFAEILYKNVRDDQDNYLAQHNAGLRHTMGLSFNRTFGGWLNFNQSVSGTEVWFDRDREGNSFARGFQYSTNTRLSHSIYGIALFPDFPIRAVRHIMTPAINYSYSPDYSHRAGKYYSFGGMSLSSVPKRRNVSFSLAHKWSMKYYDAKAESEKALNDVLTLNSSLNYDLEKDEKPFSDISHSATFRPSSYSIKNLSINYNTTFSARQDAYDFDIINWRIGNNLRLNGDARYQNYFPRKRNVFFTGAAFRPDTLQYVPDDDFEALSEDIAVLSESHPWNLSITHDYSRVVETKHTTQNLRSSVSFRLTHNWAINYNNYYNLETEELISQSLSVDRDLDCWRLSFTWSKHGDYWNYRLMFYNIQLPDVLRIRRTEYRRDRF